MMRLKLFAFLNFLLFIAGGALAQDSVQGSVELEIKTAIKLLNKTLPKEIDKNTILLGIEQKGLTLIYHVQANGYLKKGLNHDDFYSETKSLIEGKACSNQAMKYFAENNVKITYKYNDKEGMPLGDIPIELGGCF
ncbi:MAG: hypothetical protein JJV99_05275 [Colwellia sp.]|nr:hypothetical protein [Colwellia sp.]